MCRSSLPYATILLFVPSVPFLISPPALVLKKYWALVLQFSQTPHTLHRMVELLFFLVTRVIYHNLIEFKGEKIIANLF